MKCVFHPGASVYHKVTPERMTMRYFYQRGFNQGISDSYTSLREAQNTKETIENNRLRGIIVSAVGKVARFFEGRELRLALEALRKGHKDGFDYHQQVYRDDLEVREWVHRSVYY